jgi:hypothetical protein
MRAGKRRCGDSPASSLYVKRPTRARYHREKTNPTSSILGQGTFEREHDYMGALPLFLVPIAPDREGMRYEAVFNRFVKEPQ